MKHRQSRKSRHNNTRHRGPKHLIHDISESYYDGIDSDIYGDIYGSKLSAEERCYIDPWDLENYDYVRKKLSASSIDERSTSGGVDCLTITTTSPAGEPSTVSSQFFYLPNNNSTPDCMACLAGMDEHSFYNNTTKYETIYDDDMIYSDFDNIYTTEIPNQSEFSSLSSINSSSAAEINEEENSSVMLSTSLKLHTPGFGVAASGRRKLTLPKPVPHLEFPAPPPYDYCIPYGDVLIPNYAFDCYECMSNIPIYGRITTTPPTLSPQPTELLYSGSTGSSGDTGCANYSSFDSTMSQPSSLYSTYSNRFEISKKGLLQIDYSCNWNDLDRLIGKDI
ncbi:uncharacterized protein LOC129606682 [Condylostylus longicornis]|uniref:uncharacterized protein LOC129606682 n=1 Tax=Condylostylus longicornis TaxID=2530218 RepID=UPI00244E34D0|nr:uncharacterized protein LOC129606682 [Condylostylus longicornis]XP_055373091.1 uncharacterized protein LOC129606682 [Condylostylus longicornis]